MAEITPLSEGVSLESPDPTGSTITLPTFNTLPSSSQVASGPQAPVHSLTLPIFDSATPTGLPSSASSFYQGLTPSSFNALTLTESFGPEMTHFSDPATLPTSKNLDPTPTFNNPSLTEFSGPAMTYLTSLELPGLSPNGLPGPQTTGFSPPVSSALTAYGPVSTVAFSRLQTSFSAIAVGSNILAVSLLSLI
jgi:hypothetical protein